MSESNRARMTRDKLQFTRQETVSLKPLEMCFAPLTPGH